MGISYRFYLRLGYTIASDIICKQYKVVTEEQYHYEDRYDSKTGEKVKPQFIIDKPADIYYQLCEGGYKYCNVHEIINETNHFQEMFGCGVSIPFDGNMVSFYIELPEHNKFVQYANRR